MSYQPEKSTVLHGRDGDLVFVSVRVDSRRLEEVLDALASLAFPINPEIRHGRPDTLVEFPAYDGNIDEIQEALVRSGLDDAKLELWRWTAGINPAAIPGGYAATC